MVGLSSLFSCELRLALLEMCRQPFFRVCALEEELLELALDGEPFEESGLGA
jgi:hypothetical protein